MEKTLLTKNRNNPFANFFTNYKCVFIFLVIFVVLSICSDVFLSSRNLMNLVRQIAASSILGVGFTLVVASGNIDLSVGTMIGMIGVLTALLSKIPGMPMIAVLLVGIAVGLGAGALNAFFINLFNLPSFIVTLANMSIFEGICYLSANSTPVSQLPEWYEEIGQGYFLEIPVPVWIMIAVAVVGTIIVTKTVFGRNVLALGGNKEAARVCGVNTTKVMYGVFMMMGICAAITAFVITGRSASAQTSAGQGMELDSIAAVVIGGTPLSGGHGSIIGTVVGCLIVGSINNGLNLLNVDSNWQLIAKGLLILGAIILDAQSAKLSAKALKKKMA
ncbi:ABC transporter permease [Christensenella massiliensis]|uniref:ABC transporter permease n=1 Tax=Christensenella massiliensis TaxID=1805714 RepID=A0AAU8A7N9_9FIRM